MSALCSLRTPQTHLCSAKLILRSAIGFVAQGGSANFASRTGETLPTQRRFCNRLKTLEETIQTGMAELFPTTSQSVNLHLKVIFAERETDPGATCKDYLQVPPVPEQARKSLPKGKKK